MSSSVSVPTLDVKTNQKEGLADVNIPRRGAHGQLLNPMNANGLEVEYCFSRKASIYSTAMNAIDLTFTNRSSNTLTNIHVPERNDNKRELKEFETIETLLPGASIDSRIHINFLGSPEQVKFPICFDKTKQSIVKLVPSIGELITPDLISHTEFEARQKKLQGMNEAVTSIKCHNSKLVAQQVMNAVNIAALTQPADNVYRFSGRVLAKDWILLIELVLTPIDSGNAAQCRVCVKCDDMMFISHVSSLLQKLLGEQKP